MTCVQQDNADWISQERVKRTKDHHVQIDKQSPCAGGMGCDFGMEQRQFSPDTRCLDLCFGQSNIRYGCGANACVKAARVIRHAKEGESWREVGTYSPEKDVDMISREQRSPFHA